MPIVPLPLCPDAEAQALLHYLLEQDDLLGRGINGRAIIQLAVDDCLLGCGVALLPHPSALVAADDAEGEAVAPRANVRCSIPLGCTRARDVLRISYTGAASPFPTACDLAPWAV